MAHDWHAEPDGSRWRVVHLCDNGYRAVFAPSGDPERDRYETKAAALWMASTLNVLDTEDCLRA